MSDAYTLLRLKLPSEEAVSWLTGFINKAGLRVVRTFDLQDARHHHAQCPCPHHGTDLCDCQLVVLLVYGNSSCPVSLLAHSYDGQTFVSLVDNPQQRADFQMERTLRQLLSIENYSNLDKVQ
jgi:hypothetical protein